MLAWISELVDSIGKIEMIDLGTFFNELCNWVSNLMM